MKGRIVIEPDSMRLDKWLWAARFYKTRGLAQKQIELGRIKINGEKVKNSKIIKVGDVVDMNYNSQPYKLTIERLNLQRRPASEAKLMYREDEAVKLKRAEVKLQQSLAAGVFESHYKEGRPTKRDRRILDRTKHKQSF